MNNTSLGTLDLLHVYGKLDVELKSQLGEDGKIEISIHDTVPGLPLGNADQIFDAHLRQSRRAAVWAWQSGSRLPIARWPSFGPTATADVARRFTSRCRLNHLGHLDARFIASC